MIYGIRDDERGLVKVGFTLDDSERLRRLQTGNGSNLKLVATFPGNRLDESALHRIFIERQERGEWFRDEDGAITNALEALAVFQRDEDLRKPRVPKAPSEVTTTQIEPLFTIKKFALHNSSWSEASLRWLVFNENKNGLDKFSVIVRVGRKVLIDGPAFFRWVRSGNQHASGRLK